MIDGLKVTIRGEELRRLLDARIQHHEQCAARWAREQKRTPEDETEEAPLLPEHICRNEEERHGWRGEVLAFIRDHVEAAETYRLALTDLESGELLPTAPEWVTQNCHTRAGMAPEPADQSEETDEFRTTRLDIDNGPEVIVSERT